jgi:Flp pilus assembly protein TadD
VLSNHLKELHSDVAQFFEEAASGATTSLDELEALSQAFPDDARGFERVGYACAQRMQSHDSAGKTIVNFEMATRALTAYQRASTLAPNNPGPYNNIGNIYFTLGNRREAVQFWVKSLDVDPRQVNSRLNLGKVFYLDGRLREAASEFQKVLEYEPDNSEALSYLKRMRE